MKCCMRLRKTAAAAVWSIWIESAQGASELIKRGESGITKLKKFFRVFTTVLLAVVFTAGCAGDDGQENGSKDGTKDTAANVSDTGLMQIEGDQLYMGEYTRLLLKDPIPAWEYRDKFLYADAFDGIVYILAEYRSGEGEDISRQFFSPSMTVG